MHARGIRIFVTLCSCTCCPLFTVLWSRRIEASAPAGASRPAVRTGALASEVGDAPPPYVRQIPLFYWSLPGILLSPTVQARAVQTKRGGATGFGGRQRTGSKVENHSSVSHYVLVSVATFSDRPTVAIAVPNDVILTSW